MVVTHLQSCLPISGLVSSYRYPRYTGLSFATSGFSALVISDALEFLPDRTYP